MFGVPLCLEQMIMSMHSCQCLMKRVQLHKVSMCCKMLLKFQPCGTYFVCPDCRMLRQWKDHAQALRAERTVVKLQKAAVLCFGSYCMRAMHSWRQAVSLRRLLKRGLQFHQVLITLPVIQHIQKCSDGFPSQQSHCRCAAAPLGIM